MVQKTLFEGHGARPMQWFAKELDDSDWLEMKVSGFWEELDTSLVDHDGAVWFRKTFDLPQGYDRPTFSIQVESDR